LKECKAPKIFRGEFSQETPPYFPLQLKLRIRLYLTTMLVSRINYKDKILGDQRTVGGGAVTIFLLAQPLRVVLFECCSRGGRDDWSRRKSEETPIVNGWRRRHGNSPEPAMSLGAAA
jgi:hypothetical protein